MDIFAAQTGYTQASYPSLLFYLVMLIGFTLIIFLPRRAFMFSIFCLCARNLEAAVFTRPLGPYLNLNDLFLWIAVFSMIRIVLYKNKIWAPKLWIAITVLLLIGALQSIFKYGIVENVLRPIWASAIFPIMFLAAANSVDDNKQARSFYWVLFWGNVLGGLQHFIFVKYQLNSYSPFSDISAIRTISYAGTAYYLLITAPFSQLNKKIKGVKLMAYYGGIILIGLSVLLGFTRSIWICVIGSILALMFFIRKIKAPHKVIFGIIIILFGMFMVISVFMPAETIKGAATQRVDSFTQKTTFMQAYQDRFLSGKMAIDAWSKSSSLIFGVGTSWPPEYYETLPAGVPTLDHVNFTVYLAHLGIVGFAIYVIFLPYATIKISKYVYSRCFYDYQGEIALLALAVIFSGLLTLLSAGSYLSIGTHLSGAIVGATWGLYRSLRKTGPAQLS